MEPRSVRIILLGDTGVGKTSLVPPTSPPVTEKLNQIETEIIDTDCDTTGKSPEELAAKLRELRLSDSVVICVVCASWWSESIDNVKQKWLKLAEENAPSIPIMIICNSKGDPSVDDSVEKDVLAEFQSVEENHPQVEFIISCDGKDIDSVREVFDTAQRLALFPGCKLLDLKAIAANEAAAQDAPMRPELKSALKHIFRRADVDGDGHLNETELNELQRSCFTEGELQSDAMASLKQFVQREVPAGVTAKGFNWLGFEHIWKQMLVKGRFETFWVILRHAGFDDALSLAAEQIPPPRALEPHELVLSDLTLTFLKDLFEAEVKRSGNPQDNTLSRDALLHLLEVVPPRLLPWPDRPFASIDHALHSIPSPLKLSTLPPSEAVEDLATSSLSLDGWLAFWHLWTFNNAELVARALPYLGFGLSQLSSPVRSQPSTTPVRSVHRAYSPFFLVDIVGLPRSGRSQLVRGFLNRPYVETLAPHQRNSLGAVAIYLATAAFKKVPTSSGLSHSGSKPLSSSKSTPSKHTPTSTGKHTGDTESSKKGKTSASPAKTTATWQSKPDLLYQKNLSSERGMIILNKHNLDTYMRDDASGRPSDIVLLTYDVSNREEFERIHAWLVEFRQQRSYILVQLVGTKSDLEDTTSVRANLVAAELQLPAPIFVSSLHGDYSALSSTIHNLMLSHRVPQWKTSSVTALGRNFFSAITPHLPKVLLVAGLAATVWVGVAHSGLILPYIKQGWQYIRSTGNYVLQFLGHRAENFRKTVFLLGTPDLPDQLATISQRSAPKTQAIPNSGSQGRLVVQQS